MLELPFASEATNIKKWSKAASLNSPGLLNWGADPLAAQQISEKNTIVHIYQGMSNAQTDIPYKD